MKLRLCNNGKAVYGIINDSTMVSYSIEAEEYKQWLADGGMPEPEFSAEELEAQRLAKQIQEAKSYLLSTDYKMTVDYFGTLTKEEQDNLIKLRAEARQFIRDNE
jgi:hypothetical protein